VGRRAFGLFITRSPVTVARAIVLCLVLGRCPGCEKIDRFVLYCWGLAKNPAPAPFPIMEMLPLRPLTKNDPEYLYVIYCNNVQEPLPFSVWMRRTLAKPTWGGKDIFDNVGLIKWIMEKSSAFDRDWE
jgi:hypothetical protein